MIIIHSDKLKQVQHLTQDKIKQLAKMSAVRIYQPGDHVDVSSGGIMLRGGLSKLDKKEKKDQKIQSRKEKIEEDHANNKS